MAAHEVHSDAPLRNDSRDEDGSRPSGQDAHAVREQHGDNRHAHGHHRVYRRRWFGLLQLVLLNVIISWDVGFAVFYHSRRY